MIYTVDEVSDLLDIPRPTLYRYLREYSIPHVRRSGKISIPEESFDRIKEARELHREGLGTASVRRRLREGNDPLDAEELTERLDRLSGALERLQGEPANGFSPHKEEALQAILEKQELLISTVSSLTEKVETLLSEHDRYRAAPLGGLEERTSLQRPEGLYGVGENARRIRSVRGSGDWTGVSGTATGVMVDEPPISLAGADEIDDDATIRIHEGPTETFGAPEPREKFGGLARRRRRIILALVLLALLAGAVLAWGLSGSTGEAEVEEQPATPDEQSAEEDSQSSPAVVEETPPAPPTTEVPNLAGMSLPEAEDELAAAGLTLGAWNEIPDYEVPAGGVVMQGPEAGEEVDPDTPVDLILSSGPPVYAPAVPAGGVGGGAGTGQYPGAGPPPPDAGAAFPPGPF